MTKRVVITGASRGIGKATAAEFLNHGWEVIGASTSGQGWSHADLSWVQLDLADSASIDRAAREIASGGKVDVLIDNAGVMERDTSVRIDVLRQILEVNLIGTIDFAEQILGAVNNGGSIVLLGSGLGSITNVDG